MTEETREKLVYINNDKMVRKTDVPHSHKIRHIRMCNKNNCVYLRRGSRESSSFTFGLPTSSCFFLFLTLLLFPYLFLRLPPLLLSDSFSLFSFISLIFCPDLLFAPFPPPLPFSVTFCLRAKHRRSD